MKTKKNKKGGAVPPSYKIGTMVRFRLPTDYYKDITIDDMDIHIDPEKYDRIDTKDGDGNIVDIAHYVTGKLENYSKEGYHVTGNLRIPYKNKERNQYNYIVPACGHMEEISSATLANTVGTSIGKSVRGFGNGLIGKGGRKKKTRRRKPKKKRRKSRRILNKRKTKGNKSKKHI